jgi:hypothetical protein
MTLKSVSRKTVSLLIFGVWVTGILILNGLLIRQRADFKTPADAPPFVWRPELYRILSFGQLPAAVDALLLKFLVEDSITHVEPGVTARVFYYLDLATDLDPAYFSLYTAGTGFLAVVKNDKASALKLITKGENFRKYELPKYPDIVRNTYWEDEWRIPFLDGYVHLFEIGDLIGASAAYHELEGLPGAPSGVHYLSRHFEKPGGIYEVGLNVLKNMLSTEIDENVIRELKLKQKSLSLSSDLFRLNSEFKAYKGNWARFKREKNIPETDPFGGKIFISHDGKIDSTTERTEVLGIR